MNIQITHQVTEFDKEELLAGLRSYNAQFVDFSKNGQLGVYCRNESGEMVGGTEKVRGSASTIFG